ncbi:MAG TPA: protein kinase [Candidatus Acidoferrales bacterium]|nr:protein kinase [Candidatus Acidoferrales bacterium]
MTVSQSFVGRSVSHYRILEKIGAGGMGEVYRATDSRLGRSVAVKILPESFAADKQSMLRFEREAQVLAGLSHPNIAVVHGFEASGETRALVMELVEGPTLADRIAQGPIPLDEALPIARQIAEAIEYAHERGIIHRDLKPSNIKVTDGRVKLLDFGLAKALEGETLAGDASSSPTLSHLATQAGIILGTAAYMPPEQAKGKSVDRRADIWAFGVVLYEMLGGKRPFRGELATETLAEVIKAEPDWSLLPANMPPVIRALLVRCLRKDPKQRLQAIGDARITIDDFIANPAGDSSANVIAVAPQPLVRRALPWALASISFLTAIVAVFAYFGANSIPVQSIRSYILPPEGTSFVFNTVAGGPVLSPDGKQLVFAAKDSSGKELLWLRPLDALTAQPLKDTEGASVPFWSPDSRSIGFFVPGKLFRTDLASGGAQIICNAASGRGGTWNSQGVIVFAGSVYGGLDQVPAAGGTPAPIAHLVTSRGQFSQRWPVFLPDGRHFLYFYSENSTSALNGEATGIYVGSLDGQTPKFLLHSESDALYASPGYLLFLRNTTLMAQRFDAKALRLSGDAFPVAGHVANPQAWSLGHFSVSQTGLLAYETGGSSYQLDWIDEKGQRTGMIATTKGPWYIRLSPDGKTLAESVQDPQTRNTDIWLVDVATHAPTRFTFNPAIDNVAVWSPDGSRMVFNSHRTGQGDLYIKNANGAGNAKLLLASSGLKFPTDWSRDGRFIAYEELDTKGATGWNIWILPLSGNRGPFPFLQTQFNEKNAVFSPDGRWLAYQSDESGKLEIYVTSFPTPRGRWQVSSDGGAMPKWRRDGKAIYYLAPGAKLMEAAVAENGSAIEVAQPRALFQPRLPEDYDSWMDFYDVASDGKRFLFMERQETAPTPASLVTNWTASIPKH